MAVLGVPAASVGMEVTSKAMMRMGTGRRLLADGYMDSKLTRQIGNLGSKLTRQIGNLQGLSAFGRMVERARQVASPSIWTD